MAGEGRVQRLAQLFVFEKNTKHRFSMLRKSLHTHSPLLSSTGDISLFHTRTKGRCMHLPVDVLVGARAFDLVHGLQLSLGSSAVHNVCLLHTPACVHATKLQATMHVTESLPRALVGTPPWPVKMQPKHRIRKHGVDAY